MRRLAQPLALALVFAASTAACGSDGDDGGDGPDAGEAPGAQDAAGGSGGGGGDLYDDLEPEVQELFDIINEERAAHGVDPVALRADLVCAAELHCDDICPKQLCQHEGTDGSEVPDRLAACEVRWRAVGETISCGAPTARGAVDGWLASTQGHRETMLGEQYGSVGLAAANNFWVAVWAD